MNSVSSTHSLMMMRGPVLIMFTASWCQPCQEVKPLVLQLEADNSDIAFFLVDVSAQPGMATEFSVRAVPTFVSMYNGAKVDCISGGSRSGLHAMINRLRSCR